MKNFFEDKKKVSKSIQCFPGSMQRKGKKKKRKGRKESKNRGREEERKEVGASDLWRLQSAFRLHCFSDAPKVQRAWVENPSR